MELSTFLWINLSILGVLALLWTAKKVYNIVIKIILFALSIGSLYYIVQ